MILVTGKNGQLGLELQDLISNKQAIFCDSKQADITNSDHIKKIIEENQIQTIINCAAYTAVDKAESEPERAFAVNHLGVKNLAKLSYFYNIKLIHISTDYVFDGNKREPYLETDPTNPINVYGQSKLKGEHAILEYASKAVIIRTSWLYSKYGNNFVKTMLKISRTNQEIRVVSDQVSTPTCAKDLALAITQIIPQIRAPQIFHFSNEGETTWFEFSKEIFQQKKKKVKIVSILSEQYKSAALRPAYSTLDLFKIKTNLNIIPQLWKNSLCDFLENNF